MLNDDDHRKLGQRLGLFHFQEEAPGMAFFHPRGLLLYRLLEEASRSATRAAGYQEVRTPQLLRQAIWEASGHWQHFSENMFRVLDQSCPAALKPVSCPGHVEIVRRMAPSYRDLPIRLAELGAVHRDEPSGTLHGLLRLRQFTQDDGHVFCSDEQAEAEVERFCRSLPDFYRAFGFERLGIALSTRPAERAGDDAAWDRAEGILQAVLERLQQPYLLQPGAGAFYGPKIEVTLEDRQGRAWQCGTIQVDLVMPKRFDLRYVDAAGERRHPVMLHRALYGSLERFLGILLEHHGARLPLWLAPEQVVVLPVTAEQHEGAASFCDKLVRAGLRSHLAAGPDSLAKRLAEAHERAVPVAAILGPRELAANEVTVRRREGQSRVAQVEALAALAADCASPFAGVLP